MSLPSGAGSACWGGRTRCSPNPTDRALILPRWWRRSLRPTTGPAKPRIISDGPQVSLEPRTVQSIAAAVHELATNAARHDALASSTGPVSLGWAVATQNPGRPTRSGDFSAAGAAARFRVASRCACGRNRSPLVLTNRRRAGRSAVGRRDQARRLQPNLLPTPVDGRGTRAGSRPRSGGRRMYQIRRGSGAVIFRDRRK